MKDEYGITIISFAGRGVKHKYPANRKSRAVVSQKMLAALRAHGAQAGKVLNPYGNKGYCEKMRQKIGPENIWRDKAVQRKRLKLKHQKAIALEMHELQELARQNATMAMHTLIEISKNKRSPEATRIAASAVILDRGYGKASQTSITASVGNGKTSDITADELDKRVERALKRVEELTHRTPKAGPSKKRPADLRQLN